MTKQDSLQRAIAYLGAVQVAPGRYARREAPDVPFEIIPEEILCEYAPARIATFSHRDRQFCGIVTMPVWWTPERRFAAFRYHSRRHDALLGTYAIREAAIISANPYKRGRVVTADLETGEEIPA